ncbi:MAG TPA: hypothetical protein VGJ64_04670 [Gemmatimonadaceae bacterium]
MSPDLTPARQLARRLIERSRAEGAPSAQPAAVALNRLYLDLARWVGFEGCHALFTRALAEARAEHPLLGTIQLHAHSTPYLEGVAETMEQHGGAETDAALESMLVIVIEVLSRLIGDEMARILIERGLPESAGDDANRERRRAEA